MNVFASESIDAWCTGLFKPWTLQQTYSEVTVLDCRRLPGLTQGQSKKKCKIMVIHLYAVSEMMNSVSGSLSLQLLSEFSRRKTWTSGLLRPDRMSSKQVDRRPFRVSELSIWLLYFEFTSFTCHVQTICVLKFNTQKLAVTTNNKPHLTIFISKGIQQNTHKRT